MSLIEKHPDLKIIILYRDPRGIYGSRKPILGQKWALATVTKTCRFFHQTIEFIDKCEWDELYFRFDDWHGHEPDYDHHERKAFREWLDKHGYRFEIYEDGLNGGAKVWKE